MQKIKSNNLPAVEHLNSDVNIYYGNYKVTHSEYLQIPSHALVFRLKREGNENIQTDKLDSPSIDLNDYFDSLK